MRQLSLLLLALAASASAQQLQTRNIDVNGVNRLYLLYIPSTYSGAQTAPLMCNFHGGSMTANDMLNFADMRPHAEASGALLAYPQGLPEPGGGPIWNSVGPWDNGTDEMGFVAAMLDEIAVDFNLDATRVYACGFSNGGNLVYDLACLHSDRFAAIAAVAGNMFEWTHGFCSPSSKTAILTIHGTADSTYNAYNGLPPFTISLDQTHAYWAGVNGADPVPTVTSVGNNTEHHVFAEGADCFAVEHFKINGGGHDWPGVFGNHDINANDEIWDFCFEYSTGGLLDCSGPPTNYCTTSPNSVGPGATITFGGSHSIAANDLTLDVWGATLTKPGLFFYGPDQVALPFGDGTRCVGGSLVRLPVVFTDLFGFASYAVDFTDGSSPASSIVVGDTFNFQFWYRDPQGTNATFNTSDGLTITFAP